MTTLSREDRETLQAAQRIKRAILRDRKRDVTATRARGGKASRGRIIDRAHLAWVRRLPCVATYVETGRLAYGCQAAHLRLSSAVHGKRHPGGQVKPDDRWVTPLSAEQHRIQGEVKGEGRFWSDLNIDPFDLCQRLYAVSGDDEAGLQVILSLKLTDAR